MDPIVRKLLTGTAICILGFKSLGFLIDSVAPDRDGVTLARQGQMVEVSSTDPGQEEIDAILNGADPTDVFEPTAAGGNGPTERACRSGKIETAEGVRPDLHGQNYISARLDQRTYIQVLPYNPSFLVQESYQTVTATEQRSIPDEAIKQLDRAREALNRCEQHALFLSAVNPGESS